MRLIYGAAVAEKSMILVAASAQFRPESFYILTWLKYKALSSSVVVKEASSRIFLAYSLVYSGSMVTK